MNLTGQYVSNSPERLARERKLAQRHYAEYLGRNGGEPSEAANMTFTCDGCPDAPRCPFVFDLYNINGDCLAEK